MRSIGRWYTTAAATVTWADVGSVAGLSVRHPTRLGDMVEAARRFGSGHRILVTGGAGVVGSHLVDLLLSRGCAVVVADNFLTGSKDNVAHLHDNPNFTLV